MFCGQYSHSYLPPHQQGIVHTTALVLLDRTKLLGEDPPISLGCFLQFKPYTLHLAIALWVVRTTRCVFKPIRLSKLCKLARRIEDHCLFQEFHV